MMAIPDWKLIELSPKERQLWLETRTAMQFTQPGLTSILYSLMNQDRGLSVFWFTRDLKSLAVDGRRIWANPDYFFPLPIEERIFAGFHEVVHAVLRHPEQLDWHRKGNRPVVWKEHVMPFDAKRTVKAMDYSVNAILVAGKVGKFNPNWLFDPAIATTETSWQEAYYKLWQEEQQQQGQPPPQPLGQQGPQQPGQGQPSGPPPSQADQAPDDGKSGHDPDLEGPQDYHALPGTSQGKNADEAGVKASDTEWKIAIKAALAAGTLPAALTKTFEQLVESRTTWTDHLQGMLARGLGGGGYDWRRADRRFLMRRFYIPARSGKGCGTIVIVGDSSGSIYAVKGLVDRIFSETRGVLEQVKPRRIVLLWCDAEIKRIDDLADAYDLEVTWREGAKGGGGTKFKPAFDWVEQNLGDIDALVYFTDGDNRHDDKQKLVQPDYPVIWGHIGRPDHTYPWGERVDIPTDGSA